jgi:hypothetical protein
MTLPLGRQRWNMRGVGKPAKMLTNGTPAAEATCWPAESANVEAGGGDDGGRIPRSCLS